MRVDQHTFIFTDMVGFTTLTAPTTFPSSTTGNVLKRCTRCRGRSSSQRDPYCPLKAARTNPYYAETRRWMGEKIMAFLEEQGMVTWYSKPIYRAAHLV